MRDIGRLALQVVEIETYRSFAAIGLDRARSAQAQLSDIAARVPTSISAAGSADSERFDLLSQLTGELEEVWRRTSFRFAACTAYWDLVTARLASLQEQAFDSRITIGAFKRRLQPAIATYQSTERRRHDLAEQITAMTGLLQTRIELDMQQQNADLLASLNHAAERQLRLQHTVEGVSTVAISYYLVLIYYARLPIGFWHASQRSTLLHSISACWLHHRAACLAQHQASFKSHGRQ